MSVKSVAILRLSDEIGTEPIPFGTAHTIIAYIGEYFNPPPPAPHSPHQDSHTVIKYLLIYISSDVEASEAPAFDVVLKADKKRLQLLEEVSAVTQHSSPISPPRNAWRYS